MLDMTGPNERAVIGNNEPPEDNAAKPEAHLTWLTHAESLVEEAEGCTAVTDDDQAEYVGDLAGNAKKAAKDAEAARVVQKKPHLDAGKAVDDNYKKVTAKLDNVKSVAQSLLTPWLDGCRHAEEITAAIARDAAKAADEEARRLAAVADQTDIVEVEKAAASQATAKVAAQEAKNAKVKPATVKGVQFRTYYTPEMVDRHALLSHIAKTDPEAMTAFGVDWMRRAVNAGAREIPGVEITEEQRAV